MYPHKLQFCRVKVNRVGVGQPLTYALQRIGQPFDCQVIPHGTSTETVRVKASDSETLAAEMTGYRREWLVRMAWPEYHTLRGMDYSGVPTFLPAAGEFNPFGLDAMPAPPLADAPAIEGAIVGSTVLALPHTALVECSYLAVNDRW